MLDEGRMDPEAIRDTPRTASSFDSRVSPPTSPHNVSSPMQSWNSTSFLSVPGARSRGNSIDSVMENSGESNTAVTSAALNCCDAKDALSPDPGTEHDFEVENNKFAFAPGQLGKLYSPKSLGAFYALGGLEGLERGLRTDKRSGLSIDEGSDINYIRFEDAVSVQKHGHSSAVTGSDGSTVNKHASLLLGGVTSTPPDTADRGDLLAASKRMFDQNLLPTSRPQSLLKRLYETSNDKVLLCLTAAAVFSLALGLYDTFGASHSPGSPTLVDWVEGLAICIAITIVVLVTAVNDWQKEQAFAKLNARKEERELNVTRSSRIVRVSIYKVLAGDTLHLEHGDAIPVDGILIEGSGVNCDMSDHGTAPVGSQRPPGKDKSAKIHVPAGPLLRQTQVVQSKRPATSFRALLSAVPLGRLLPFLFFAPSYAQSSGEPQPAASPDWQSRALGALTNNLVTFAFLLWPSIVLTFLGYLARRFHSKEQEGRTFFGMLGTAVVFVAISTPKPTDGDGNVEVDVSDFYMRIAIGLAYVLFMAVSCRLIAKRREWGKGRCAIACGIAVVLTLIAMAIPQIQTCWRQTARLDPMFAILLGLPMAFALCDLAVHVVEKFSGGGDVGGRVHATLPLPVPGPTT